jgi:hypothetical protein
MIQKYIKDLLNREIPSFEWSIENYTGSDNTGTILMNNPSSSEYNDERDFLFPSYQVYLRSSDFPKVEYFSLRVHEILNKRNNEITSRDYESEKGELLGSRSYLIIFIECDTPIRVGVEGKHLDYSINFRATLKEV